MGDEFIILAEKFARFMVFAKKYVLIIENLIFLGET
jgi:hypothetical protein